MKCFYKCGVQKQNKKVESSRQLAAKLPTLSLISIESACVRSLEYNDIIEKTRKNFFEYARVCLFAECKIKMDKVCLDWFKQCKLFS